MTRMISVVTVCRNAEQVIAETLHSIFKQKDSLFELVIVDGASTDATCSIISKLVSDYQNKNTFSTSPNRKVSNVKFISEPDKGVYDAMNKGVRLCTGEYVIFMNAGDSFYDEKVLYRFDELISKKHCDAWYGNTLMKYYEGNAIKCDNESNNSNPVMPFIHQSVIVRRELLLEHPFDTSYKILADYEFFYWMRNRECTFGYDSFVVSNYDAREGLSENNPLLICYERDRILGIDKQSNYAWRRLKLRCTIGLIQPIKDFCPRFLLNIYFRKKRKNVVWVN